MHDRAHHGCIGDAASWCDPSVYDQQCAYRPEHLKQMLERKETLGGSGYNEVLLATHGDDWQWADRMPQLIDAFVSFNGDAGAVAAMHREFHRQYPGATAGCVTLNLGGSAPFSDMW